MTHRISAILALFAILAPSLAAQDRITGRPFATRSPVLAMHGMAATSQPLATQAAIEILRAGGTAVDAAIAANAVLALTEPTGCGLGGDLFAMVWDAKTGQLHGLNGSGRSPAALTLEILKEEKDLDRIPSLGPLPVTVPGCVDGWFTLHAKFGKLPMARVLAPAIRYAREGFPVTELIAYYWGRSARVLRRYPNFADTFLIDGEAPRAGQVFQNPRLAATLELLAKEGRDAFYAGAIANKIDAFMQAEGGYLRLTDLAAHRSEWVEPVSTNYRGYDLWELPPNGQGIAALQILNILEGFEFTEADFGGLDHVHRFVEAKKLAFEDRAKFYADPAFGKIPVKGLISKAYAAKRRALILPEDARRAYRPGNPAVDEGDTIYLATADRDGNMVSLIQSNYRGMGSGMVPGDLGFMLQDRGELFDLTEGRANTYAPKKRPFHTIIPAFVTRDGEPFMAFGVMGGATQPQAHAQIVMNMVDFGMNVQEAGDAPRILHLGSSEPTGLRRRPGTREWERGRMNDGGRVALERGFPYATVRELIKRGHRVGWDVGGYGGYQAIQRINGVYHGASESRKDGQAAGY